MIINVNNFFPDYDFPIKGASYPGNPISNTVMYCSKKVQYLLDNLASIRECLVFVESGAELSDDAMEGNAIIFVNNPQLEFAKFSKIFFDSDRERKKILKYKLLNGYYIGENVSIGENAYIEPGVFIDHDVVIGNNATILTGSIIKNAIIGDDFICNENAVVGDFSFTMAEDENGNKCRIFPLGKVIIGNSVEIGTCNHIETGSCSNTVIEDYAKFDGFITLGHEAHVGKNVEIVAGTTIGGFVNIGDKAFLGLNSTVKNRINIGCNTVIGMGAVVTKSVPDNDVVVGNPAKPIVK